MQNFEEQSLVTIIFQVSLGKWSGARGKAGNTVLLLTRFKELKSAKYHIYKYI